ncbi:hypothetical protein M514_06970 [Trichuris suis]|uniref:MAM domain-containing protein n=1 Tax=Trichuris suis TaxID=68888 RepID=A0A085MWN6_9BILA|nr:hypothetical protein M514_06970 [Trichuris suis]
MWQALFRHLSVLTIVNFADVFGGARASPYDSRVFDSANGGPVTGPDQMRCDFESSCCWQNNKPPLDKLEWNVMEGSVDPQAFNRAFGTSSTPSGRFLGVVSAATDSSDEAQFHSCSIACTEEPVKVSLRHWTTDGVKLQVCTREAFFDNPENAPLLNCQELPRSSSPGPTTVELAPGEFFDVVIVAYNFVGQMGAAAIDDIQVDFVPCQVTSEPETTESVEPESETPAAAGDECSKLVCDFEGNFCSYVNSGNGVSLTNGMVGSGTSSNNWETVQGRYRNPLTGLNNAASGTYYAATYLCPNKKAVLSAESELAEERVIRFNYYKATQGIQLIGCCGPNADVCTFKTPIDVEVGDRVWKVGNMVCPAGPNKVTFTAVNSGANQGAVGLDDIKVYKSTGDPASATEPVC